MSRRKLPPDAVVVDLVCRHGHSTSEIAREYGASRQAVSQCLRRASVRAPGEAISYGRLIPWRVRVQHNMDKPIRMLRLWARREMGLPLTPRYTAELDQWLAFLRDTDQVLCYDRDEGFYYDLREPEDEGIARA